MTAEITLYGYTTSPFVRKVSCYLYYKELSFEFVGVSPVEPYKTISFSEGTQVPVLKIGDEWRRNSSELGLWLDELFPDKPLLSDVTADREKALEIDAWASEQFIPGMIFRPAVDGELDDAFRKRAWLLADIVSSGAELPGAIKQMWPELIRKAPFIVEMVNMLDREEPLDVMQARLFSVLVAFLGGGPYLGGLQEPSLADFAIYPQIIFPYQVGLMDSLPVAQHPAVGPWLKRVSEHLPANPWCVDEQFIVNSWPL